MAGDHLPGFARIVDKNECPKGINDNKEVSDETKTSLRADELITKLLKRRMLNAEE